MLDNNADIRILPSYNQQYLQLDGNSYSLSSVNNQTIIYFFAPWCQVCHVSIENLEQFYQNNPKVNVVAIALDYMNDNDVKAFAEQHKLSFPIVLGNETLKKDFQVTAYPSYYLIDKNHQIASKSLGYSTEFGLILRTLKLF